MITDFARMLQSLVSSRRLNLLASPARLLAIVGLLLLAQLAWPVGQAMHLHAEHAEGHAQHHHHHDHAHDAPLPAEPGQTPPVSDQTACEICHLLASQHKTVLPEPVVVLAALTVERLALPEAPHRSLTIALRVAGPRAPPTRA